MSTGLLSSSPVQVGDYQDAAGKVIYSNAGPKCAKCSRPHRQCICEPTIEVPGENTRMESPATRQAASLELIAYHASKITKLMERLVEWLEKAPVAATEPESTLIPVAFGIPGVTSESGTPVIAPEKIAENEAKKVATIERMKGAK